MTKRTFCLSLVFVVLLAAKSNAGEVSYLLEISSGWATTSGGFVGGGMGDLNGGEMGDLTIQGTFKLNIDSANNYAKLENIDILLVGTPSPDQPVGFDWSSLEGTINGNVISLSSPSSIHVRVNQLDGTFDGSSASLTGTVYEGSIDGYIYYSTINATPEPATLSLLALGGLALLKKRKV
jgi:hypothetical protein